MTTQTRLCFTIRSLGVWISCLIAALTVLLLPTPPAAAQEECDVWRAGPLTAALEGSDGSIFASTVWDPDGIAGPTPPWLVVAGSFTEIGGVLANHIAAWDGTAWHTFSSGMDGTIYALVVQNGNLVAGGQFVNAGGGLVNNVSIWQGGVNGAWTALTAGGQTGLRTDGLSFVSALAVYNTELYIGGANWSVAGGPGGVAQALVRWTGSSWLQVGGVGGGVWAYSTGPSSSVQPAVNALLVINNELIIGGGFALNFSSAAVNLAHFNGTTISALGGGIPTGTSFWPVSSLAIYGAELAVGGRFFTAGSVSVHNVAAWNGTTFRALGSGISDSLGPNCLITYQSQLIAGGGFTAQGGANAAGLLMFNGTDWQPFAGGVSGVAGAGVACFSTYNNSLVVGGAFERAGTIKASNLALWTQATQAWAAVNGRGSVYALAPFNGRMVCAGNFQADADTGGIAHNIMTWNGIETAAWGAGTNGPINALKVQPIAGLISSIAIGGQFTTAGGQTVNHIARWQESDAVINSGWFPMGAGFNSDVYALERFGPSTYAAGSFTASGATPINRIARWTGTAWEAVGTGLNGTALCMKSYYTNVAVGNRSLVIGGVFTNANGVTVGNIASFNQSDQTIITSWTNMSGGLNFIVRAVERYNGFTYAGGDFTADASGATPLAHIARWTGTAWVPLTTGVNGPVYAMLVEGGFLYVAGTFTSAGGVAVHNIARWNGTAWSDVRDGTDSTIYALAAFNGEVHAGGDFTRVNSNTVASPGVGRYLEAGVPWFARSPSITGGFACSNNTVTISAAIAEGYNAVSMNWRRNGLPISDGPTGSGSTITGTSTFALTITNLGAADTASYDVTVSTFCGSATSSAMHLTICAADMDSGHGTGGCDGGVTIDDLLYYLDVYTQGHVRADLDDGSGTATRDGGVTIEDLLFFLARFDVGC